MYDSASAVGLGLRCLAAAGVRARIEVLTCGSLLPPALVRFNEAYGGLETAGLFRCTSVGSDFVRMSLEGGDGSGACGSALKFCIMEGGDAALAFLLAEPALEARMPLVMVVVGDGPGRRILGHRRLEWLLSLVPGVELPLWLPAGVPEVAEAVFSAGLEAWRRRIPAVIHLDDVVWRLKEGSARFEEWLEANSRPERRNGCELQGTASDGSGGVEPPPLEEALSFPSPERCLMVDCEDARLLLVAYGSTARIAMTVVEKARKRRSAVGLLRPSMLSPFPLERRWCGGRDGGPPMVAVMEHNGGVFFSRVLRRLGGHIRVGFVGRDDGAPLTPFQVLHEIQGFLSLEPVGGADDFPE